MTKRTVAKDPPIFCIKKTKKDVKFIVDLTYKSFLNDEIKLSKPLDRRLIIDINTKL